MSMYQNSIGEVPPIKRLSVAGARLAIAASLLGGLVTTASATPSDNTFYACLKKDGNVSEMSVNTAPECKKNETLVQWNQPGPQGAPGPQGGPGPQGVPGPSGVVGYYVAYATFPGYSGGPEIVSSTALCDAGDMATGGGWSLNSSGVSGADPTPTIRANGPKTPDLDPTTPIGWTVAAYVYSAGWAVPARAICADLTP